MSEKEIEEKAHIENIEPNVEPSRADENALPDDAFDPVPTIQIYKAGGTPVWLAWLRSHVGERETGFHGHKSNPFILGLFKHTATKTHSDQTPWCAAAVSSALELTGHKSTHSAAAVSYTHYGQRTDLKPGAIVVFRWPKGGHHVSVVSAVGRTTVRCCGGNQGNALKESVFSRGSIIAIRWPA